MPAAPWNCPDSQKVGSVVSAYQSASILRWPTRSETQPPRMQPAAAATVPCSVSRLIWFSVSPRSTCIVLPSARPRASAPLGTTAKITPSSGPRPERKKPRPSSMT